jgi:hypothetical protein
MYRRVAAGNEAVMDDGTATLNPRTEKKAARRQAH